MSRHLHIEIDDRVLVATIDVAGRPMNVFVPGLAAEIVELVRDAESRPDVAGIVLRSGKPGSFFAGADLKLFAQALDTPEGTERALATVAADAAALRVLERCRKPVAVVIDGAALGGGFELCLACHHRIACDSKATVVGLPEVTLGLLPAGGGTQRLPRLIGVEAALPLLLSGRSVPAAEALGLGLVDRLLPAGEALAAAREWVLGHPDVTQPWDRKGFAVPGGTGALAPHAARTFAHGIASVRQTTRDNLPAPMAILAAVYHGTQLPFDKALQVEAKHFATLLRDPVAGNLIRSFLARQAANKLARRSGDFPTHRVTRLGVIGAGMMGTGIAKVAAAAGIDVVLIDSDADAASAALGRITAALAKDRDARKLAPADMEAQLARLQVGTDMARLAGCDFVIEAVFEQRAIKAEVLGRLALAMQSAGTPAVVASNTSTLSIDGLASHWPEPAKVIGMHFFSPVDRMPLLEVIVGERTGAETLARALDLAAQLRKTPLVVRNSPSFFTSRIFCAYIDEGMAMLTEGIAPALIENAARQAGFPVGPLAVTDEVTLGLQKKVIDEALADGLHERFLRVHAQPVVKAMLAADRSGRKAGGGFYEYPEAGAKRLWPGLADMFPVRADQPDVRDVRQRLLYIEALEAARCLEEGVIIDASDGDLGSILGVGYPAWTGGALSLIDMVGLDAFVAACDRHADTHGERFRPSAWLRSRAPSLRGTAAAR